MMKNSRKQMSLRMNEMSAAIHKCMDCFVAVLLAITIFVGHANAQESSAVCQILASHKPEADVTHQGGADINPAPFQVPNVIKVPLDVNLAQRVASLTGKGVQMEAPMGMVEIHQDGTIRYNDQDWTVPVNTLCGNSYGIKEVVAVQVQEAPIINKPSPIINQAQILNTTPILNHVPAGDRAGEISEAPDREKEKRPTIVSAPVAVEEDLGRQKKTKERTLINVRPTQAIPPKEEEIITKEPEVIAGGDYREIFTNE